MADVRKRVTIMIEAETVGDVTKWMQEIEETAKGSTPLIEPVTLEIQLDSDD